MCDNPRIIRNPVLGHHRTGFDKPYIKANCGWCLSCRHQKSRDWTVRTYFEKLAHLDTNSYFVTLDFDDMHLPKYKGTPCFDSEIMKRWFKLLRNRIGRFRYFYATDYGGFLQRPHYHVMFMVSQELDKLKFFDAVRETWSYGSHGDIETIDTVNGDPIKAVNYVAGYVTKDVLFDPGRDLDAPQRFRPKVQASIGWGASALELGYITSDDIRRGKICLPLGKNGKEKEFPIPEYYVRKYTTDTCWDSATKKVEQWKNEFGRELQEIRHNSYYEWYLSNFYASRNLDLTNHVSFAKFKHLFPNSAFHSMKWHDIVHSCFDDADNFFEFIQYKPFFHTLLELSDTNEEALKLRPGSRYVLDVLFDYQLANKEALDARPSDAFMPFYVDKDTRPEWQTFYEATLIFDYYKFWLKHNDHVHGCYQMRESAKYRALLKIQRNIRLRRYLVKKKFNFNLLKPSPPPVLGDEVDKFGNILHHEQSNSSSFVT